MSAKQREGASISSGPPRRIARPSPRRRRIARLHFNFGMVLEQSEPPLPRPSSAARSISCQETTVAPEARRTLVRMGKFEDAIAECRDALEPEALPRTGLSHDGLRVGSGAFDESIAAYEQAIRYNPGYTRVAYNTIGLIEMSQKEI